MPDNAGPDLGVDAGVACSRCPAASGCRLREPFPVRRLARLWRADARPPTAARRATSPGTAARSATATWRAPSRWPTYQNVYADRSPGSAEMASAGRPFTARLLVRLMARGVDGAPLVLHTGVSSPELHEPPRRSGSPSRRPPPGSSPAPARRAAGSSRSAPPSPGRWSRPPARTAGPRRVGLDRPGARPRPAGPGGHRPGHRPARAGGQPPAAARRGRRCRPGRRGLPARRSPGTYSGTSSATRCCSCPEAGPLPGGTPVGQTAAMTDRSYRTRDDAGTVNGGVSFWFAQTGLPERGPALPATCPSTSASSAAG